MVDIFLLNRGYKPTYNWGAPPCKVIKERSPIIPMIENHVESLEVVDFSASTRAKASASVHIDLLRPQDTAYLKETYPRCSMVLEYVPTFGPFLG